MTSPPTTPKTGRPFFGRILRSHTKNKRINEKHDECPKITGFFNVRKRLSPVTTEKAEYSKKRRGMIITDSLMKTSNDCFLPETPMTPFSHFHSEYAPSPPKRLRENTCFGVFDVLGTSEKFDFVSSLPISLLSKLALTSVHWCKVISNYVLSNTWKKRFVSLAINGFLNTSDDPFEDTGILFKALTISKLVSERIKFLINFIEVVQEEVKYNHGWFKLITKFCYKWQTHEKMKLARAIKTMSDGHLEKQIKKALIHGHGEKPDAEIEVRKLLHCYFVNPLLSRKATHFEKKEAGFWLSCILHSVHNISLQGRLCMIIFAPVVATDNGDQINWRTLVDDVVISAQDAECRLFPLANAVSALITLKDNKEASSWRHDEVFNLIEEITTYPDPWSFDNFVAFLLQCGNVLPIAVCTRINHNHREEAGQIINTMKTLLFRWGMNTTELLGRPFRHILNTLNRHQRECFVFSILDAHQTQCREFLLLGDIAHNSYEEEVLAQLAFSSLFNEAVHLIR